MDRPRQIRSAPLAFLAGVCALLLALPAGSAAAMTCGGKRVTIKGTPGDDVIVGKKASDVIYGGGGGDRIYGGANGNDTICAGSGDDTVRAGRGFDKLYGGGGNDQLLGESGSDTIEGGSGEDVLEGEKGGDRLAGGAGDDLLMGDKGNDRAQGGGGEDRVEGGPGDDAALGGGPGSDSVLGGPGIDNADGGPGDFDVVRGDSGTDTLSGGAGGDDIVSYASATRGGIEVDLAGNRAKGDGHDTLSSFEDVVGSPQADTLVGDGSANRLDGGVGNDTLESGGGGGEAFGGPGSDDCSGFSVDHSCGPEPPPPPGQTSVILNQGLDGSSLVVQGGPGNDDLRVSQSSAGWTVADAAPVVAGDGCGNQAPEVVVCAGTAPQALVVITGGAGDDRIVLDGSVPPSAQVRANGNAGSDTLEGGPGDDQLEAGENYNGPDDGNDTLVGNAGNDVLYADPGADRLEGGAGDDLLVSSVAVCQGHTYDGGSGSDTVSYGRSNAALRVELGGTGGPAGCGSPDHVLGDNDSLEGSDGPDVLVGDGGPNSFLGHLGADSFVGKGGNDFIDAADGRRDKQIACGGGDDEVVKDRRDPASGC